MTKNPFLNAVAATTYIVLIATTMNFLGQQTQGDDGFSAPILGLSLLTLSAAVMGYIFLSMPLRMYLDGEKKGAVDLFLKTVGVFAGFTIVILFLLLSGIF